jgi:hypothetical protein
MDARELGLRLLTLSDPDEVRTGLSSLTKAAEPGDVEAQVALGRTMFSGGRGASALRNVCGTLGRVGRRIGTDEGISATMA